MSSKWTIKKLNTPSGSPLGYPWHAIPPHTPIPPRNIPEHVMRDLYKDDDVLTGATHGEVMGYVNKKIREKSMTRQTTQTIEELEHFRKVMEPTPPFLDALIAEKRAHAELRKRIEERIRELKQPLCSHMPEGDELDDYLEQWDRQSYEAAVLTEILEGTDGPAHI